MPTVNVCGYVWMCLWDRVLIKVVRMCHHILVGLETYYSPIWELRLLWPMLTGIPQCIILEIPDTMIVYIMISTEYFRKFRWKMLDMDWQPDYIPEEILKLAFVLPSIIAHKRSTYFWRFEQPMNACFHHFINLNYVSLLILVSRFVGWVGESDIKRPYNQWFI